MNFNNEDFKNKKANQKQNKIEKASKSFNKQLEASERQQQQHEEAKAKAASEKMMLDLEKLVKEAAKQQKISDFKTKSAKKLVSTFRNRLPIDKHFNNKILNVFEANNRTPTKQITGRFSSINYRAMQQGKRSLKTLKNSLTHSLRLQKKDVLEWEDQLTEKNLYFYNNTIYKGDEFNDINQKIFDEIISDKETDLLNQDDIQNKKAIKRLSTSRANYRKKVLTIADDDAFKKVINMLENRSSKLKGNEDEKIALIINKAREMAYKRIENLNLSPAKAEQKKRNFENFINIRDKHIKARSEKRIFSSAQTCLIQESVFKIPHKNGDLSKIEAQEYMQVAQTWFKKAYPNHPVIFGAIHLDETADLSIRSGDNLHFFVNGKNFQTGEYDIRQAQIDFARKEQHRLNKIYDIDFNLDEDNGYRLTDKEMTLIGQIINLSFYTEMQNMLFRHNIALKFLNSTEKSSFEYIQACLQEQLPLSCRTQSRYQMKKEMTEQAQIGLEKTQRLSVKAKQDLRATNETIENKQKLKKELSSNILSKLSKIDLLNKEIESLTKAALKKINYWQRTIEINDIEVNKQFATKEAAEAIDKLNHVSPKVTDRIVKSAVKFESAKDNFIEERFKVSNQLIYKSQNKRNKL
ncbi:hypothetical protein [Pseudoalteromonas peptidolytica]|uniref:Uncharacterized protein n=1 Tax=Pseudoalteromonas peptidolytica F12-50-A1 TaxID=1315280 RepID=A0A8I0MSG0_9GAMM|nr:hypothetical protein [Pseudoalteromonas peptidolytica]MBE0344960.1 hypothetical protein [Pseudoalteromonas peptidolytica F12-50-A1]NLR15567.1 hypothetical protein [Pseudoalteromonas peptidolytica]GEK08317.1 hypothetical protein PPE03_05660 [Pseudoalteromonas peptidolytica]